ncbi:MAG: plasmid mobilization relaxosome protein MobC [Oscillospiraceae bacterium]|nr:plasmid mobilization relaxosome protein MobC [Oscillospiraceae bacterium]
MKKKDIKFSTRMASEDREQIKELAKQANMSMSNYVTSCCLGQQIVIIEGLKEVLKELKAIGNNLNQMVTLAHMGKITVVNLSEVRQLLADIRITVREIAERKRW